MEKSRRAEKLVALLRWMVIGLGLSAAKDDASIAHIALIIGLVAVYNGPLTWCLADPARFSAYGKRLGILARGFDTALISVALATSGTQNHLTHLLYWFVLVSYGFTSANLSRLFTLSGIVLAANALSTIYASGDLIESAGVLATRSAAIVLGVLVAAFVAKSRSQDDLVTERGSHLHAISDCGARLTSFRSVHELALHVLESAVIETSAAGGELLLVNDNGELECEAFFANSTMSDTGAPSDSVRRSYAHWAMSTGREFLVRNGGKPVENADPSEIDRAAIAVPLLWHSSSSESDSSVLGVLIVWAAPEDDFVEDAADILRIFAAIAGAAIVNLKLYTNLQKSFLRTLQTLANGLEARDEYTQGHSERVMTVACMIANELGVPTESVDSLRNAALLHDIGKIGVPDAVLRKAGKLSAEEWETMRRHTIVSEEICRPLGLQPETLFLIKHHHERLDGKGYPDGLSPQDQPLLQRILVVSDSFDAMRSRRPYRDVMPQEELVSELTRSAGRTMDPTVVEALLRLMDRGDMDAVYEAHDRLVSGVTRSMKAYKKAA